MPSRKKIRITPSLVCASAEYVTDSHILLTRRVWMQACTAGVRVDTMVELLDGFDRVVTGVYKRNPAEDPKTATGFPTGTGEYLTMATKPGYRMLQQADVCIVNADSCAGSPAIAFYAGSHVVFVDAAYARVLELVPEARFTLVPSDSDPDWSTPMVRNQAVGIGLIKGKKPGKDEVILEPIGAVAPLTWDTALRDAGLEELMAAAAHMREQATLEPGEEKA